MKDANRVTKIAFILALGFMTGAFCFVLWAVLEHGVQ